MSLFLLVFGKYGPQMRDVRNMFVTLEWAKIFLRNIAQLKLKYHRIILKEFNILAVMEERI